MCARLGTDDADGRHRMIMKVVKVWRGRILAAAAASALLAAQAWAADFEALRRICASGTVEELRTALRTCSADEPFPDGNRPLHIAAEHASDPGIVECLLDGGASLSAKGLEGLTPLMLAAAYNPNAAIAEALLRAGADPNLADEEGRTPLHLAAALNESPKVMAALLRAGASPKARDGRGRTPLWTAAARPDAHGVELLLGAGAPADESDDSGITPLLAACERPDAAVLRLLTEAGADTNVRAPDRCTPLMRAAAAGADAASFEALLSGKANVRAQDDQNRCALSLASENPAVSPDVLERLIDAGADPDTLSNGLETPLMAACRADNLPAVRALLRRGADIGLRDQRLWTPLFFAAASGASADLLRTLAASGASIDETAAQGTTPLMAALESPKGAAALRPLLELGANPNLKNAVTITPLMMAAANDDPETVALLLAHGADPTQGTWDGLTPLMVAARRSRKAALLEALVSAGAPVDQPSGLGMTPLMVAAASGNAEGVRILLALSADVKLEDADGMTALTHSVLARDWNAQAAELLIEGGSDVEARTLKDMTPLMEAAYRGNAPAARFLLDAGAKTDARDRVGWTPLHFAAKDERGLDVLTMLIAAAAEAADLPDLGGTTPLMVAAASNNLGAVAALLRAGADPTRTDDTGRDSLGYARLKGAAACVSLLEGHAAGKPLPQP